MYHLVSKHLPSLGWKENISQAFSIIQAIGKAGASLSVIYYLSKSFKKFILSKYSINEEELKKEGIKLGEVPIEICGYPELCPTDILLFNLDVNNHRIYHSSLKARKILNYILQAKGNEIYEKKQ